MARKMMAAFTAEYGKRPTRRSDAQLRDAVRDAEGRLLCARLDLERLVGWERRRIAWEQAWQQARANHVSGTCRDARRACPAEESEGS